MLPRSGRVQLVGILPAVNRPDISARARRGKLKFHHRIEPGSAGARDRRIGARRSSGSRGRAGPRDAERSERIGNVFCSLPPVRRLNEKKRAASPTGKSAGTKNPYPSQIKESARRKGEEKGSSPCTVTAVPYTFVNGLSALSLYRALFTN